MGSLGGMLGGGPSAGGMGRPGSLLARARAAQAAGTVPQPDPNAGRWVVDPATVQWDQPKMMFVLDNPTPAPAAAGAPTGMAPLMQNAAQNAAAQAAPVGAQVSFPIPASLLGTLGETGTAAGGTAPAASTAPTSRRRRAPSRGRNATLLSGSETAETLGA